MATILRPGEMAGRRVCLFVSYAPDATVRRYVRYHLDRLKACGLTVLLLLVADEIPPVVSQQMESTVDGFFIRRNAGFDFGAWADGFRILPSLWDAEYILLVNDSVYGPIGNFSGLLERIVAIPADFVGLTESFELRQHFQSFFILMKRRMLQNPSARSFWSEIRNLPSKADVIQAYEINLAQNCIAWGLTCQALFSSAPGNPTHLRWRDLLQAGFPYIKVELLRDNPLRVDISGWRKEVVDAELLAIIEEHLISSGATATFLGRDNIRRNEPCPCGSGKRFKQCHGRWK